MGKDKTNFLAEPPEIILDPQDRWWVSRLNRLKYIHQECLRPEKVKFRDCTLREGEETPGTHLSNKEKLSMALMIQEVGLEEIEVGYCGAIEEHFGLAQFLREGGVTLKLTSINRSYAKDGEWQEEVDRAVASGIDCISFVVFCNDDLLASVPWLCKEAIPERVYECVSYARKLGVDVAATLAGATRTNLRWIESFARAASTAEANTVGLADSMGCSLPDTVSFLIRFLRDAAGPNLDLAFHGHNTFGLATANALAAINAGAGVIDVVPLGLGEGAGIIPLENVAFILEVLYGVDTGLKIEQVADLCRKVRDVFGVQLPPNQPFIGDGIYRHSIDSHIASILRGAWHSWECVHPSVVRQERQLEFGYSKIRRGHSGAIGAKIEQMGLVANDDQLNQIIDEVREITEKQDWASEMDVESVIHKVLDNTD
jgi:isopropylmalate/homocitrate/citramalate synthase